MSCPFFQPADMVANDGEADSCTAVVAPFVPTYAERRAFCAADHRSCALYRHADRSLMRAVYREVARAIG
jgi:hypothetical protein